MPRAAKDMELDIRKAGRKYGAKTNYMKAKEKFGLTYRQYIFANEYFTSKNGALSAEKAGYSGSRKELAVTGVKNLKVSAGVMDSGFRNEWFVCLYNGNDKPICIAKYLNGEQSPETKDAILYPYSKAIAQALIIPVPEVRAEEIPYEELQKIPSERGMGQLGSSNK